MANWPGEDEGRLRAHEARKHLEKNGSAQPGATGCSADWSADPRLPGISRFQHC